MAEKRNQIPQLAILPYRLRNTVAELLLITSTGYSCFELSKGYTAIKKVSPQSAIKEAFEGAGINGKLD